MQKFEFVNDIKIMGLFTEEIIDAINGYKYLQRVNIALKENTSEEEMKEFREKFGQRLRFIIIKGITDREIALLLRFTPNLETFVINNTNIKAVIKQFSPILREIVISSVL